MLGNRILKVALVALVVIGCASETTGTRSGKGKKKPGDTAADQASPTPDPNQVGDGTPDPGASPTPTPDPGSGATTPPPETPPPTPTPTPTPFPLDANPKTITGLGQALTVTYKLPPGGTPPATASIRSGNAQDEVTIALALKAGTGDEFEGSFSDFERLYVEADGSCRNVAGNACLGSLSDTKLGVYAEGDKSAGDPLTIVVDALTLTNPNLKYDEPGSTVTGLIRVGGQAIGGAGVQLFQGASSRGTTVSRSDGSYTFYDVLAGTYTVVASKRGAVLKSGSVTVR